MTLLLRVIGDKEVSFCYRSKHKFCVCRVLLYGFLGRGRSRLRPDIKSDFFSLPDGTSGVGGVR